VIGTHLGSEFVIDTHLESDFWNRHTLKILLL
jgi:hypothetical protein